MARTTKSPWKRGDRVILYIRVSSVGTRKETLISPDVQIRQGKKWAQENKCVVVDIVQDIDKSGRDIMKRQLREQIKRVGEGEAEGIVVWKVSRWGRDVRESLNAVYDLHKAKGFIGSTSENLEEIDTPSGKLSLTMYLAMAQFQSDQIGETWVNILDRRRELGLPPNGTPRFGYVRVKQHRDGDLSKEYQPDPTTGPWLAKCYEEYVAGKTVARIVRMLNDNGITTTKGKRHTSSALLKMLDSGWGAGLLVDRRRSGPGKNHPREVDYAPGVHEPVIDEALWKAYVKRRMDHKTPPRIKGTNYRLAGLLRCGSCEGKLYISWQVRSETRVKYRSYRCRKTAWSTHNFDLCPAPTSIRMEVAEEQVLAWLRNATSSEEAYAMEIEKAAATGRAKADLNRVDAEVEKYKKRIDRINEKLLDAEDFDEIESQERIKAEAKQRLAELRDKRYDLETMVDDGERVPVDAIRALVKVWDHADPSVVNTALKSILRSVYVERTKTTARTEDRLRFETKYAVDED